MSDRQGIKLGSYAQKGEDFWLWTQFEPNYMGTAIDVGAHDGVNGSNTFLLELLGWKVLSVEASPLAEQYLMANRGLVWMGAAAEYDGESEFKLNTNCPGALSALKPVLDREDWKPEQGARWDTYTVKVRTLNTLLQEHDFARLDALSIDVEGGEMDVLRGLDLQRWRPRAVVIEAWDDHNETYHHMKANGYIRTGRRHVNDLWVLPEE